MIDFTRFLEISFYNVLKQSMMNGYFTIDIDNYLLRIDKEDLPRFLRLLTSMEPYQKQVKSLSGIKNDLLINKVSFSEIKDIQVSNSVTMTGELHHDGLFTEIVEVIEINSDKGLDRVLICKIINYLLKECRTSKRLIDTKAKYVIDKFSSLSDFLINNTITEEDTKYNEIVLNHHELYSDHTFNRRKVKELLNESSVKFIGVKGHPERFDYVYPSRLTSALIPLPRPLRKFHRMYMLGSKITVTDQLLDIRVEPLRACITHMNKFMSFDYLTQFSIKRQKLRFYYAIESIFDLINYEFRNLFMVQSSNLASLTKLLALHDFSLTANHIIKNLYDKGIGLQKNHLNYVCYIVHKLRQRGNLKSSRIIDNLYTKELTDGLLVLNSSMACKIVVDKISDDRFCLFLSDGYVTIMTHDGRLYFMSSSYFDYLVTVSEIRFNCQILINIREFSSLNPCLELLMSLLELNLSHNIKVDICKSLETLCLIGADIRETQYISWFPILKVFESLPIEKSACEIYMIFLSLLGVRVDSDAFLVKMVKLFHSLSPTELIDLSTAHKFAYYSEVNEDKGIMKLLKRVHTKREVNDRSLYLLRLLFRKSFIFEFHRVHKKHPRFECGEEIRSIILKSLKYRREYQSLQLNIFAEVKLLQNFRTDKNQDPLIYAKDKSCSKSVCRFDYGDSIPELLDLMKRENYEIGSNIVNMTANDGSFIYKIYNQETAVKLDNPVRLCMKEREQKSEGRLFGCASLENKHELSYLMILIKDILSYFPGEMMTITNEKKRRLLYEASKLLVGDNAYCLLLDIEGHNQSMQSHNLKPLLEEIGDLYGDPSIANIHNYFSNIDVYYYKVYMSDGIYSKGQYGGIEGFCNPLWTLFTLLKMYAIKEHTSIDVLSLMVYSDDCALIFNSPDMNQQIMNNIYQEIISHFRSYGFIVKPSQTMITKYRCTMLRMHYYNSVFCEMSIKRVLSISGFSESNFINEYVDVTSLVASTSSAVESSNKILTQIYLKWYRSVLLTYHSFLTYIDRNQDSIFSLIIKEDIRSLFKRYSYQELLDLYNTSRGRSTIESLRKWREIHIDSDPDYRFRALLGQTKLEVGLFYMLRHKDLVFLYFVLLTLPNSVGGYGIDLLINQIISGHSNSFVKTLYQLSEYNSLINRDNFKNMVDNIFYYNLFDPKPSEDYSSLISDEYPILQRYETSNSIIKRHIAYAVSRINRNNTVSSLFELRKYKKSIYDTIIDLNRGKFSWRILAYYAEKTCLFKLDLLLNKVETSRQFAKRLGIRPTLYYDLQRSVSEGINNIFAAKVDLIKYRSHNANMIYNDRCMDVLQIMDLFRELKYGRVKFVNISEPYYANMMLETFSGRDCEIRFVDDTVMTEGKRAKKRKAIPKDINIKKVDDDEELKHHISPEAYAVSSIVFLTKWLLSKTDKTDLDQTNVYKTAEFCLSTLCPHSYSDLEKMVSLPSGGEIYHRLDNYKFTKKAYTRSLNSIAVKYATTIDTSSDFYNKYQDSNINFAYLKELLLTRITVLDYLSVSQVVIKRFKFKHIYGIKDVAIDFTYHTKACYKLVFPSPELPIDEIRTQLTIMSSMDDKDRSQSIILVDKHTRATPLQRRNNQIIDYYLKLRTNCNWESFDLSSNHQWIQFHRHIMSNFRNLTPTSFKAFQGLVARIIYHHIRNNRIHTKVDPSLIDKCILEFYDNFRSKSYYNAMVRAYQSTINHLDIGSNNYLEGLTKAINKNVLNSIRKAKDFHIRLITEFAIKHCLHLNQEGDDIYVNVDRTLELIRELLENNYIGLLPDPILVFINMIGLNTLKASLSKYQSEINQNIRQINRHLNSRMISLLRRTHKVVTKIIDIPELPGHIINGTEYNEYLIDIGLAHYLMNNPKALSRRQRNTEIGSNPEALYSATGSNNISAMIGLGHYLKRFNIYNICDLTAGRGDGYIALCNMGYKVTSYSTKDMFVQSDHIKDLIIMDDYDVTEFETLGFATAYDLIIIDISHIRGKLSGLFNSIYNFVVLDKLVILRLNSIETTELSDFIMSNIKSFEMKLLLPNESSYQVYQIYMMIKQGKSLDNSIIQKSIATKELVKSFYRPLVNRDIYFRGSSENRNDVVMSIDLQSCDLSTVVNSYYHSRQIQKHLDTIEELLGSDFKNLILIKSGSSNDDYDTKLSWFNKAVAENIDPNFGSRFFRDQRKIMMDDLDNYELVSLAKLSDNEITILGNSYPFMQYRRLVKLVKYLRSENFDYSDMCDEIYREKVIKHLTKKVTNPFATLKKELYEALIILCHSTITDSYVENLRLMENKMIYNKSNKRSLTQVLIDLKKLSPLYDKLKVKVSLLDETIIDRISKIAIKILSIKQSELKEFKNKDKINVNNLIESHRLDYISTDNDLIDSLKIDIDFFQESIDKLFYNLNELETVLPDDVTTKMDSKEVKDKHEFGIEGGMVKNLLETIGDLGSEMDELYCFEEE